MTRVLVCGGRDFDDIDFVVEHMLAQHEQTPFSCVIHGGARGVDTYAGMFADELGIPVDVYPADWDRYQKRAGFIRNQEMLDRSQADMVMAFPGGNGTADMVERCKAVPWLSVWESKTLLFKKEDPKYGFLSNFAVGYEFVDPDGLIWSTSEHYYQAHKSLNEKIRGEIQMLPTAFATKQRGKSILLRPGWDPKDTPYGGVKEQVMRQALEFKFSKGSVAGEKLLETGSDYLIEHAPWKDYYWGVCNGLGLNRLGKLLMERRSKLVEESRG